MRAFLAAALTVACLLISPPLQAGSATVAVKARLNALLRVAQQPRTPAQQAALHKQLDATFDYRAMSRAALGKHWSRLTPAQQSELTSLRTRVYQRAQSRLIEYAAEHAFQMRYIGERATSSGVWVLTQAHVPTESWRVDYLVNQGKVADLRIDGTSWVQLQRSQLLRVLRKGGYEQLVTKLKARLVEPMQPLAAPPPQRRAKPSAKTPDGSSSGTLTVGAVALIALVAVLAWYDR